MLFQDANSDSLHGIGNGVLLFKNRVVYPAPDKELQATNNG